MYKSENPLFRRVCFKDSILPHIEMSWMSSFKQSLSSEIDRASKTNITEQASKPNESYFVSQSMLTVITSSQLLVSAVTKSHKLNLNSI